MRTDRWTPNVCPPFDHPERSHRARAARKRRVNTSVFALASIFWASFSHADELERDPNAAETVDLQVREDPQATEPSVLHRLRFGMPLEASVIGLTVGARPEILFPLLDDGPWLELRVAAGMLPGPEYLATPVSVGLRGRYLDMPVHPLLGLAFTQEILWISDASPVLRGVVEADIGLSVDVHPQWAVDALVYSGWAAMGEPGPVAGMRLGLRFTPSVSN